jgi:putative membrane protein
MILAAALVLAAAGFVAVCARLPGGGGARPWWFLAGIAALAVALVSPVHGWSERSLAGHMVQHVLLISLAAPLLAAAHPFEAVARSGRPDRVAPRPVATRSGRDKVVGAGGLAAVGVVQVGVLLGWHVPASFDAAVAHQPLHDVEHLTLLGSAFALWAVLLRARDGAAVVALFVATLPAMGYGVALTLAGTTWYVPYPDLPDQQLAGVVMWAYGGLLAVGGGVLLAIEWLRRAERSTPGWLG